MSDRRHDSEAAIATCGDDCAARAAARAAAAAAAPAVQPHGQAEAGAGAVDIEAVARQLESFLKRVSRSLEFHVDDASGRMVCSVRDARDRRPDPTDSERRSAAAGRAGARRDDRARERARLTSGSDAPWQVFRRAASARGSTSTASSPSSSRPRTRSRSAPISRREAAVTTKISALGTLKGALALSKRALDAAANLDVVSVAQGDVRRRHTSSRRPRAPAAAAGSYDVEVDQPGHGAPARFRSVTWAAQPPRSATAR